MQQYREYIQQSGRQLQSISRLDSPKEAMKFPARVGYKKFTQQKIIKAVESVQINQVEEKEGLTKTQFKFHYVIGKGGSGKAGNVELDPATRPATRSNRVSPLQNERILPINSINSSQANPFTHQMQQYREYMLQQSGRQYQSISKLESPKEQVKFPVKGGSKIITRQTITKAMEAVQINQFDEKEGLTKLLFKFHYVIGKGGFGKVWKVELAKTKQPYAMKVMSKAKILSKKSVHSVLNERILLSSLSHPLLANIHCAFQDKGELYLVMDLLTGGDLRYHLGTTRWFTEYQTKFFCASIILALEYLHSNNIIHRDIKPENLVFDQQGFLRVTDLGIARILRPENNQDTSGTPGYMAPEVMFRQNHGTGVDFFAVGIIAYEFMNGRRPYQGRTRKEIRDSIVTKQVQVKKSEIPLGWTIEAADFVNRMIQRKPSHRLGFGGPDEVKSHPWFLNFPWVELYEKQITSPFLPTSIEDNKDYQNQISQDNDTQDEVIQENKIHLRRKSVQSQFDEYNYDPSSQLIMGPTGSTYNTQQNTTTMTPKHSQTIQSDQISPRYRK